MSVEGSPLQYLNRPERRLLGWIVLRMFASASPRFARALAEAGPVATARMACVNTLRLYAIVLFFTGLLGELLQVPALAYPFLGAALACMVWSCWCLYTAVAPEREFKRDRGAGVPQLTPPPGQPVEPVG